jgi:hypothetical protein
MTDEEIVAAMDRLRAEFVHLNAELDRLADDVRRDEDGDYIDRELATIKRTNRVLTAESNRIRAIAHAQEAKLRIKHAYQA